MKTAILIYKVGIAEYRLVSQWFTTIRTITPDNRIEVSSLKADEAFAPKHPIEREFQFLNWVEQGQTAYYMEK